MLNMLIALVRRGHELDPQQITHLIGRKFKGARQLDRGHVVGKQVDEGTVELAGGEGIGLVHGIDRHETVASSQARSNSSCLFCITTLRYAP